MKDLQAVRGRRLLREMIAEGEHERQDFKFAISDARKIARSLSAFANHKGGRLLIGVKDNGVIAGVRNEEDIFVVEQAAERYCRPARKVEFKAYRVENDVCVIVAEIEPSEVRPVYACEPDGSWKAYFRVADENIAAHPLMVEAWCRKASSGGAAFALDGWHRQVLAYLGEHGPATTCREIAVAIHISEAAAESTVASLAALDLVEFIYDGSRFVISISENQ